MEELLPFIFFIAWLIIGSLGGKKKKEEAERRAEAQRRAREAQARAREAAREARDNEGRIRASSAEPVRPAPQTQQQTGTSLDMVPDELWAILTGGAPRPTGPTGPVPMPEPPTSSDAEYDWQPAGPDRGGWVTEPPWDEEDAVDSIEGVSAERTGEDTLDYDDFAEQAARARYENVELRTRDELATSRDAVAIQVQETSERRHYEFHDALRASEIGGATQAVRVPAGKRLGLHDLDDVRRAIVLSEILGKPKALRD